MHVYMIVYSGVVRRRENCRERCSRVGQGEWGISLWQGSVRVYIVPEGPCHMT